MSIRKKIILLIFLSLLISLTVSSFFLGFKNYNNYRDNLESKIYSATKVVAENSIYPIRSNNYDHANRILSSLSSFKEIEEVIIFDADSTLFASFRAIRHNDSITDSLKKQDLLSRTFTYDDSHIYVSQAINDGEKLIGFIIAVATTNIIKTQEREFLVVSIFLLVAILLITTFIGLRISDTIINPILDLAKVTSQISEKGDVSLKVIKRTNDEIGILYDNFNKMLDTINDKSSEINKLNENLEVKISQRTLDLNKAMKSAESANKAKSFFIANMSHEIRTPLNAVIGFTHILEGLITDSQQLSYLDSIKKSGNTLLYLINDILDLSKIDAGMVELNPQPVDILSLLNEITDIYTLELTKKPIDLKIIHSDSFSNIVEIDEKRFKQILVNLIGNSVKFTDSGRIKIQIENMNSNESTKTTDLLIAVEDTGIGIPKESHINIFDAFQKNENNLSQKYQGTGLGLSITKKLVELMNGKISFSSEEGIGTRFEVFFQNLNYITEKFEDVFDYQIDINSSNNIEDNVILVVDDVLLNRKLVKGIFKNMNVDVIEASNGLEAIEKVKNLNPNLILMDIRMLGMDGIEATKIIREFDSSIPIIALSASLEPNQYTSLNKNGFNDVILKPIKVSELFDKLSHYLSVSKNIEYSIELDNKNPNSIKNNQKIYKELSKIYYDKWTEVSKKQDIDLITNFANELKEYAQNNELIEIITYCNNIIKFADRLDIDNLNLLLDKFDEEISKIKN